MDEEDSLDSDSDMLLGDTDNTDEELEVNEKAPESLKNRKSAKVKMAVEHSDDDF